MKFGKLARTAVIACTPVLALGLTACGSSSSDTASTAAPSTAVPTNVTAGDEQFCQALADFDNQSNLSGIDDSDNPDNAQMQQLAQQLSQFNSENAGTMPAGIKPAFESLAQDLQTISDASGTDTEQLKGAIDTITSLKAISDWTKTNCGFDF